MDVRHQVEIACTPAALWPWLTEPALLKEWVPGFVEETPDDPARTSGVGTRSTMKLREGSRVSTYQSVVTRWEPERAVAIRLSGGSFAKDMHMDIAYEVTPTARGCRLEFHEHCDMKGLYLLLAPVFWIAGRANVTKALAKLAGAVARSGATA